MKRKALVCSLIAVAAVAIIATAGGVRATARTEPNHPAERALAPGLTSDTLTEAEIRSAVGDDAVATTSYFGRLAKAPSKVDPTACEDIAGVVPFSSFIGVEWLATRGTLAASPQSQHSH